MLNLDPTDIALSIFFGIIGMGYYSYGKKGNLYFQLTGVGLMVYPYFIDGVPLLVGIGIALIILPFVLTKMNQ